MPNIVEPGIIERHGSGTDLIDKEIDMILNRVNRLPLQGAQFVRVVVPKTAVWDESTAGNVLDFPRVNQDTDELPYATPASGFPAKFTVVDFRIAVRAARALLEDDQFGKVRFMMSGLLDSGRRKIEVSIAALFNNGFTGTAGADSKALFANDHPQEDAGQPVWSNLETAGALTHAAFSTSRTNHRKQVDEKNNIMPIVTKMLVVSSTDEQVAREINVAELVPDNSLNQPNVWQKQFTVSVYDWLTSTTAWFLFGDLPKERNGLLLVQKSAPNLMPVVPGGNPDILFNERLRMRFVTGFTTEKNIRGNAGA